MKTKINVALVSGIAILISGALFLRAQNTADISGVVVSTGRPVIAVPDLRGSGAAGGLMDNFNSTLWTELQGSGVLTMAAKSFYPLNVPQRRQAFKAPTTAAPLRRGDAPRTVNNGPWLTDWSGPPVNANYLVVGYTGEQDGRLVLYGWLYNLAQQDLGSAQVIGKLYYGSLDAEGAKKVAREFAADILQQFGAKSLDGSKIYFVSDRTGNKEIWSMDYDGSNQKQLTNYKSITSYLGVSQDGKLYAFTTFARGNPQIMIHSAETGKRMTFLNPVS